MSRVQPICNGRNVLFNDVVRVYEPVDWPPDDYMNARKGGEWMQAAVDRHRFSRRIKQTESELGDIFTDAHRLKVSTRCKKKVY